MPTSNKTGLVLKISVLLFVLLATVVFKLNDYFKSDKLYTTQAQLHNKVGLVKTTVSSQLIQLKNTLSSYENELSESNINWVQLDPFFALVKLDRVNHVLKVNQMLARSGTTAERWDANYFEKALTLNKSELTEPILVQLFQDKLGAKYLIIRFKTGANSELAVVGFADYFQKFFDIERGEASTALLVTSENILAAHSEGDYIATQTQETQFTNKKFLIEKIEIAGTNLTAMNYILKRKIASGFVVPWSIVGFVLGFGCILVAVLFYSLDPIEKRVERYKKQEREQIYKETVGGMIQKSNFVSLENKKSSVASSVAPELSEKKVTPPPEKKEKLPKNFYSITEEPVAVVKETAVETVSPNMDEVTQSITVEELAPPMSTSTELAEFNSNNFVDLQGENKLDMADIERALALDDFDSDAAELNLASEKLEKTLMPQKISISATGVAVNKPNFSLKKKDFIVDEFKVIVRRPERS